MRLDIIQEQISSVSKGFRTKHGTASFWDCLLKISNHFLNILSIKEVRDFLCEDKEWI